MRMTLDIPDEVAARLPGDASQRRRGLLLELACGMYAARTITHAQGAELAGLERLRFQHELGLRDIPTHYTLNDWNMISKQVRRSACGRGRGDSDGH